MSTRRVFISAAACFLIAAGTLVSACKPAPSGNNTPVSAPQPAGNQSRTSNQTPAPPPSNAPQYIEIYVGRKEFNPSVVTIPVGSTVNWVNRNDEPHMIISDDGFLNGNLPVGGTWSCVFNKPGTFSYGCSYWTEMNGTIYVK